MHLHPSPSARPARYACCVGSPVLIVCALYRHFACFIGQIGAARSLIFACNAFLARLTTKPHKLLRLGCSARYLNPSPSIFLRDQMASSRYTGPWKNAGCCTGSIARITHQPPQNTPLPSATTGISRISPQKSEFRFRARSCSTQSDVRGRTVP
jgi:hypothetical protein